MANFDKDKCLLAEDKSACHLCNLKYTLYQVHFLIAFIAEVPSAVFIFQIFYRDKRALHYRIINILLTRNKLFCRDLQIKAETHDGQQITE